MLEALQKPFYPVLFAFVDWTASPVYVHSAIGEITWGGHDWHGLGYLGSVTIPAESTGVATTEATLGIAGVEPDLGDFSLTFEPGRVVQIYLGCLTDRPGGYDGKQPCTLVSDPVQIFFGLTDTLQLKDTLISEGIQHEAFVAVSTGVEARSNASVYHSNEDQIKTYPTDTAGQLVILSYAMTQRLRWPAT